MDKLAYHYNKKKLPAKTEGNPFINRVILYDDNVIILYDSNDKGTKKLSKKQLKDIENAETIEEIRENSLDPKKFKRVSLGAEKRILAFSGAPR